MSALDIRSAGTADADAVIELWRQCELIRPWNEPSGDFTAAISGEASTVLVGESGNQIVATVMAGSDGHRGWMYYLAVDPRRQRSGFGRSMVVAAEAWLASIGIEKVQLMVRSENAEVAAFYNDLGYSDQNVRVLGRWLAGN